MRLTRHTFTVYPPCYRPGDGYKVVHSVLQAKKLAYKFGVGAEVWRWTRTKGRKDDQFLHSTSSSDFEFEVCD
jgi:hypothetical protein